ncbi:non-ribosomal peptide synthetase, partial [Mycobacteroides saopaulense]
MRYLNPEVDLPETDPAIGFNYLGRLGGIFGDVWRMHPEDSSATHTARMVPTPLGHTLELNAAALDTDAGIRLEADWTWASSVLDRDQVSRLNQLWFDALAGICAHVRRGGGGLTPSDVAPAILSQGQIDELSQQHRIAGILPLTPLQQGLLYHAGAPQGADDVYAMQLSIALGGALDPDRLCAAVQAVVARHPHLAARFCEQFQVPVQVILADPAVPWQYIEVDVDSPDVDKQIEQFHADERAAVCDLANQSAIRAMLIRVADQRYRFVLTTHHIVLDGWSMPILLQEIFAGLTGQRLPVAPSYRSFVGWLAERDHSTAHAAWREALAGFDTPV